MYSRTLIATLQAHSRHFPVLLVTGPRQVGKTTLLELTAQAEGKARRYVTLDDFNARALAKPTRRCSCKPGNRR